MSPRCLYFTDDQVYFACNLIQSCESMDESESPLHSFSFSQFQDLLRKHPRESPQDVIGHGVFRDPSSILALLEHCHDGDDDDDNTALLATKDSFSAPGGMLPKWDREMYRWREYWELVSAYCSRDFSCQSDALDAVRGILTRLTTTGLFPGGFLWGLPREELFDALMWLQEEDAALRPGFPSWSWLGWQRSAGARGLLLENHGAPVPDDVLIARVDEGSGRPVLAFRVVGAVHRIRERPFEENLREVLLPKLNLYGLAPAELTSLLIVVGWVVPFRISWIRTETVFGDWDLVAVVGEYRVHLVCYSSDISHKLKEAAEEKHVVWVLQMHYPVPCGNAARVYGESASGSGEQDDSVDWGTEFLFMLLDAWEERCLDSEEENLKIAKRAGIVAVTVEKVGMGDSGVFKDARYEYVFLL